MRKISIILKFSIFFICIIFFACIALGVGTFYQASLIIDQNTLTSIEHVYNLMDNTISSLSANVDSFVKLFSFSQEVRDFMRLSNEQLSKYSHVAVDFTKYVDNINATHPNVFRIKFYKDEKLTFQSGGILPEEYNDELSEDVRDVLKNSFQQQYWISGSVEINDKMQDTVRVFSSIYDLNQLEVLGILEIEYLSTSILDIQSNENAKDLKIFLISKDEDVLVRNDDQNHDDFILNMKQMEKESRTLQTEQGSYFIFRKDTSAQVGTFYFARLTDEMRSANRDLMVYMFGVVGIIVAIAIVITFFVLTKLLSPLVQFRMLVREINLNSGLNVEKVEKMQTLKNLRNEVGELAVSFDLLLENVRNGIIDMEKANDVRRKLELELLMSQIKPHFLYNTLEVVCSLSILKKTDEIYHLAKSLGKFYRLSLSNGELFATVENELCHIENYINIERIRVGYSFEYSIQTEENLKSIKVLKMLLQPVVENALVHGVRNLEKGGVVSINVFSSDDEKNICFEILDNGVGIDPIILDELNSGQFMSSERDSFGMRNVNTRIKLHYGEEYGIRFFSVKESGTRVLITLPREHFKSEETKKDVL